MKKIIDHEINSGRLSRIHYFFYLRVWLVISVICAAETFVSNSIYGSNHLRLQIIIVFSGLLVQILFFYYVLPGKGARNNVQDAVFKHLILDSNQRLKEFIENFFVYKKMRGYLTQGEIFIVGQRYSELLKEYIPEAGEFPSDTQTIALKKVPKLRKFLAWYSKNVWLETIEEPTPKFFV